MIKPIFLLFAFSMIGQPIMAKPPAEIYALTIYHFKTKNQEDKIDQYLKNAYLPALHRLGKTQIGVFKPLEKDTAAFGKIMYVLVPFKSLDEFSKLGDKLQSDPQYKAAGSDYINSKHNEAPYSRMETILLIAFPGMTKMETPNLQSPKNERIYELRSYEGPTEKLYKSKVKMFNDGDEIGLFKLLNFNAVFYAEVIAGSKMPNLMYLTTFDNMNSRDEHWKAFSDHPQWKKLLTIEEYKNTVSKAEIFLLKPAEYSDY